MRLDIDPDCFRSDIDLRLILNLIHLVQSGRHEWQPTREAGLAADDYFDTKVGERKRTLPEYLLVKKAFEKSGYPRAEDDSARIRVTAEHLADLVHDLAQPMAIVVENRFNDGECLIFQARLFQRDRIVRAEQEGWIEFCNSGGAGQLPDHGVDQHRRFRKLIRMVLVVDGDICVPGAASEHVRRLKPLRDLGVLVFIWPGRELENFLPLRVFVDGRGTQAQQWADAIRALPWSQRAHIDIKHGISRVPKQREAAFHETIPATPRGVLTGKGYKIPHYEKMRVMPVMPEDLDDLPPEAQRAIQEMLDLIESVL